MLTLTRCLVFSTSMVVSGCQTLKSVAPQVDSAAGVPRYDRTDWRHWVDADHDCQDTRQETLVAESLIAVTFTDSSRCKVKSGKWMDPYSGETFADPKQLDVDHMVPLGNAHISGGWSWTAERRRNYANDLAEPEHLIAVSARLNRAKSDHGPDEWRPPHEDYWCQYATEWQAIKTRWHLSMTNAEKAAINEMLASCP